MFMPMKRASESSPVAVTDIVCTSPLKVLLKVWSLLAPERFSFIKNATEDGLADKAEELLVIV
tara:strand:- start:11 stop:199 length:189 start_codon:yes stop_codon:yes gene_type:complete